MRVERARLESQDAGAVATLAERLRAEVPAPAGIASAVAETISLVRSGGDAALADLGRRFDGVAPERIRVDPAEIERAVTGLTPELRDALETAIANVRAVAEAQGATESVTELPAGQRVEMSEVAVRAAGIYVPGGRAPYPSTVVMGVVPARVAGVERVVVASPPGEGGLPDDAILAAASLTGADEVLALGGAQAIAALAHGTESVRPVDVIAGPGSPWVQEAKLQCSRVVGIDGYAGPSELLVLCDGSAPVDWVALDLCAQAEHGDDGILVAASADPGLLDRIGAAVTALAADRPSVHDARVTLVETTSPEAGAELAQALAPEHLELACADAERIAAGLTTPGCIFVGTTSATAFGDYAAGSNHVLPTGGAGRFTGPLGPSTFRRRISRVEIGGADGRLAHAVDAIARAEGFPVHGESALVRRNGRAEGE